MLAPMQRGIRLTTGAEFALRDAIRTPVQLGRAEPIARDLFPLAERLDNEPWMGARPCTPDMMPIIGKAPRHANLWFAFGHAHHGLTLGPVTGRLIGEMMTGRDAVRRSGAVPRRSVLRRERDMRNACDFAVHGFAWMFRNAGKRRRHQSRNSRWIRSGPSRCRATGSSGRSPASRSTGTTTSGSCTGRRACWTTRRAR